jgi:hypothetical protein
MSNSEPSAIVLKGIFCIRGLYSFNFDGEIGSFAAIYPLKMQVRALALWLRISRKAGVAEVLLGVLAQHLAFMATNGAFHNNFGSGCRRSVHVGWRHTIKLRALKPCCNTNRHGGDI